MTSKQQGNLCTRCKKNRTTDSVYWTCDDCVAERYKNPRDIEIYTFKLPGNP